MVGERDQAKSPMTLSRSRRQPDIFDRVFEWTEQIACPHTITDAERNRPEPKADMLDYVFTNVESMTCHNNGVRRLTSSDDRRKKELMRRKIKPMGQEGDLIDYVFENVESFTCADERPSRGSRRVKVGHDMRIESAKKRAAYMEEPDEEIQLFYRPQRPQR